MTHLLRQGWRMTKGHTKIAITLFLYHAIWSFVLYRIVDGIVAPLLKRYPEITGNTDAVTLFWMENQFQVMKTDIIMPYVYTFLALLLIRMIITPLLQAGLFYSIHHRAEIGKGTYFRKGIALKWKKVTLLFWFKNILLLVPFIWIMKPMITTLLSSQSVTAFFSHLNWSMLAYLIWALFIGLFFYLLQLGSAWEMSMATILRRSLVHALSFIVVSLIIAMIYIFFSASIHALSILWVSFISFLLYQLLPLIHSFMKVWMVASQHAILNSDRS